MRNQKFFFINFFLRRFKELRHCRNSHPLPRIKQKLNKNERNLGQKSGNFKVPMKETNGILRINSSDGRVVRAFASGAVDLGLIPRRVKPITLKLVFTTLLLDAQHYRANEENKPEVYLLCRWEGHLAGFHHLGVVDRWLATHKRAGDSALVAFS